MISLAGKLVVTGILVVGYCQAQACDCAASADEPTRFVHYSRDAKGKLSIRLPENAQGVLYTAGEELVSKAYDEKGNHILGRVPRAIQATDFAITDLTSKRLVAVRYTQAKVGDQLGWQHASYFLAGKKSSFQLDPSDPRQQADIAALARRHRLPDITAAVDQARGLLRVGPASGFVAGHTYLIRALRDKQGATITVHAGARMALAPDDSFALVADGPARAEQLSLPMGGGMCSGNNATLVQPLRYAMPRARDPYAHLAAFFTRHKLEGEDAEALNVPPGQFVAIQYRSSVCDAGAPFGESAFGALKDISFAGCRITRAALPRRYVKGYVGMLEVEDSLHETPVLEVVFGKEARDACFRLKIENDKVKPLHLEPTAAPVSNR